MIPILPTTSFSTWAELGFFFKKEKLNTNVSFYKLKKENYYFRSRLIVLEFFKNKEMVKLTLNRLKKLHSNLKH